MTREEAIKILSERYSSALFSERTALETLIPELKESEDERMIRAIIDALYSHTNSINLLSSRNYQMEDIEAWLEKQKEQKPAEYLSKEKVFAIMNKLTSLSFCVPLGSDEEKKIHEITCDVSSLLDYPIEQKPVGWSEEDEAMRDNILRLLSCVISTLESDFNPSLSTSYLAYQKEIDWLKSLRPQPKKELSIEKAIKWLDDTFYFLDNSSGRGRDCEITTHDFDSLEEMYDSFRKAVIVDSEPHWKPSEEQMTTLLRAECVVREHNTKELAAAIAQLYEQLKKLM